MNQLGGFLLSKLFSDDQNKTDDCLNNCSPGTFVTEELVLQVIDVLCQQYLDRK